jgi:hypothetical protein
MTSQSAGRVFENHFTWIQSSILVVFLLVFGALTFAALRSGSPDDVRERPQLLSTLATPLGPLVGAIARRGQGCCLQFSLGLLPYCGSCLLCGGLMQILRLPFQKFNFSVRIGAWCLGLFGWFAGIPLSFLHALC